MDNQRELLSYRAAIMQDINSRMSPHRGQAMVEYVLDQLGVKFVFVQCGRKWGKTAFGLRQLTKAALLPTNNAEGYLYVAPEDAQAKEIVWATKRAHRMVNPAFIADISETDMRILLKNGRFIKIDGSNNYKKHEGTQPGLLVCDEFKRFKPQFWEIMEPNLAVFDAAVLFLGAPPDQPCQYIEVAEFVQHLQATTGEGFFLRQPSWMNDKVPGLLHWLARRREQYVRRQEFHIWQREYEALYIRGGKRRIFPMFERSKLMRPHAFFVELFKKNSKNWDKIVMLDPANDDTFGGLIMAAHPQHKILLLLDVIYQKDRALTSCSEIWRQVKEKIAPWHANLDDWLYSYDDHESWFAIEMQKVSGAASFIPAGKQTRSKGAGISTIKDILVKDCFFAHEDNTIPFCEEMESYQTDENGNIIKGNDHLIDPFRYVLTYLGYDPNEIPDKVIPEAYLRDPWLEKMAKGETETEEARMDDFIDALEFELGGEWDLRM